MRFVHGVPTTWDSNTATVEHTDSIGAVAWSPCNKLIAVAPPSSGAVQILDAVTLERRSTTSPIPEITGRYGSLLFSPDSGMLTLYRDSTPDGDTRRYIINWDLQTGGLTHNIETDERLGRCKNMTYSGCGTMLAAMFQKDDSYTIYTYDTFTGAPTHPFSSKGRAIEIWTHGDCLRFATLEQAVVTIWEVGFTLRPTPTAVQSLSAPDNVDPLKPFLFHPTLFHFAFELSQTVLVWDARNSRFLLNSAVDTRRGDMSFSPDGRFFAYQMSDGPTRSTIIIWKVSPTGYLPHQRLTPDAGRVAVPLFSCDGELIFAHNAGNTFQLWRTENPVTSPASNLSTNAPRWSTNDFALAFSPNETLAVVARAGSETITVLDLKLGVSRLTIDVGTTVYALRVSENTVFAVCPGKVLAWDVPGVDGVVTHTVDVSSSTWSTTFDCPAGLRAALISPDTHYIVTITDAGELDCLGIYDTTTGKYLKSAHVEADVVWFSPDSSEVWYSSITSLAQQWKIVKDGESGFTELEYRPLTVDPPGGFPWQSTRGYQVTGDGWILGPGGRRLLWLPRRWRLDMFARRWSGHYVALLHRALSEVVVLDLRGAAYDQCFTPSPTHSNLTSWTPTSTVSHRSFGH